MITELIYLGRDNENVLDMSVGEEAPDFSGVTRMVMSFAGSPVTIDSALHPERISWSSEGQVTLSLGSVSIEPSKYMATLVAYDPLHDDGQVIFHAAEGRVQLWFVAREGNGNDEDALEALAVRVGDAEEDIVALTATAVSLDSRVDALESEDTGIDARLDAVESAATSLDGRLDTAESEIDALQAADTALDGRLDALEAASSQQLYAELESAASAGAGTMAVVSDVGVMVSNGSAWIQTGHLSATWANRGAGAFVGQSKLISDVGPSGGAVFRWDGTYWRLTAACDVIFDFDMDSGVASSAEQILKQGTLPAGILRACRSFEVQAIVAVAAIGDTMTGRIRLGPLGTTSDPILASISTAQFLNTTLSAAVQYVFAPVSATSLEAFANQAISGSLGNYTSSSTAVSYPQSVTVSNIDSNALIVSASMQPSAGTQIPRVGKLLVRLFP